MARIESGSVLFPGAYGFIRLQGYYFNEFRGPGSGLDYNGYEGDVLAEVRLQWDTDGFLGGKARIWRSDNVDQSAGTELLWHNFSTPITFDTDYRLSIEYADDQLILKCNDESYVYTITTTQYKAYREHRGIKTRAYFDPGEYGYLITLVDEVYVDGIGASDLDSDSDVDSSDLSNFIVAYSNNTLPDADINGDGTVNLDDVVGFAQEFSEM
jgi:hypothetical protein